MSSRLWNKVEFVPPKTLEQLWIGRDQLELTPMGVFAAIVNELGHGDINQRPWAATLDSSSIMSVLELGLINVGYMAARAADGGVDQRPFLRAYAYLILAAVDGMPAEDVSKLVVRAISRKGELDVPEEVQQMLLLPILDQLLSEIQDVCSADCKRMMLPDRTALLNEKDEVPDYWLRLEPNGSSQSSAKKERRILRIEKLDAPCLVGFPVNKEVGCPLFSFEPAVANTGELLILIKRVAAFRKAQAAQKRCVSP